MSPQKKEKRIAFLEKEIRSHRHLYYNRQPEISDTEFDLLVDELEKLAPDSPVLSEALVDLFRGGEDENHFTLGFSLNTPAGLQFQLAGDFTDGVDEYVLSAIYRFGRVRR